MGKRKSRTVAKVACAPKVQKVFDCPFCSHNQAIEVKMERTKNKGTLACRICGASFMKSPLMSLTKEVDIYMEWIDLCEAKNNPESQKRDQNELGLISAKPKVTSPKLKRHFEVEDDSEDEDTIRNALDADSDDNKYVKSKLHSKTPREERKQEEPHKMVKSGSLG